LKINSMKQAGWKPATLKGEVPAFFYMAGASFFWGVNKKLMFAYNKNKQMFSLEEMACLTNMSVR